MDKMDPENGNYVKTKLECPICFEKFRPPIFQCSTGHTLCENCLEKLETCPFCKSTLINQIRNYYLEDLCQDLKYQCKFKNFGCEETIELTEMEHHEEKCIYRNFQCFVEDCIFDNNKFEMIKHIRRDHTYHKAEDNFKDVYLSDDDILFNLIYGKVFITADDILYKICYKPFESDFHVHSFNAGLPNFFTVRYYYKDYREINVSVSKLCLNFNEECCWDRQNVKFSRIKDKLMSLNTPWIYRDVSTSCCFEIIFSI